jgi:hypothetical protein
MGGLEQGPAEPDTAEKNSEESKVSLTAGVVAVAQPQPLRLFLGWNGPEHPLAVPDVAFDRGGGGDELKGDAAEEHAGGNK